MATIRVKFVLDHIRYADKIDRIFKALVSYESKHLKLIEKDTSPGRTSVVLEVTQSRSEEIIEKMASVIVDSVEDVEVLYYIVCRAGRRTSVVMGYSRDGKKLPVIEVTSEDGTRWSHWI